MNHPLAQVFNSEFRFCLFWKIYNNRGECPPIDFEQDMVIVLHQGLKRTSGNQISATYIEETDTNITVYGETLEPPLWQYLPPQNFYPAHVVSVPKTNKTVDYVIERVREPAPFPFFLVSIEDDAKPFFVVTEIQNLEGYVNIDPFYSDSAYQVFFDEDVVAAQEANDSLLGIDGVSIVEPYPPVLNEDDYYEDWVEFEDVDSWRNFNCFGENCYGKLINFTWFLR